jgi:leucyl-tRNA synthetase
MTEQISKRYDPQTIEARRQAAWRARDAFRTPEEAEGQQRKYIKPSAPFTSGNIHIGHVRSYSIGDAYARFSRARGHAVLFSFGFDAFGLPAELGAISSGESPSDWVSRCASHMQGQLERLGFSFDWSRSFLSSDALMYRWSQWLFLTLLEAGLIYQGTGTVDWCETCRTTLATIQVEDGLCWRCHNPVQLIQQTQWYLRISSYVPENDARLEELEQSGIWDESSLASQRFVLGRLDGIELDLSAPDGVALTVFTPHADALAQARFVAISPRHPDVERWVPNPAVLEQLDELRSGGLERDSRDAEAIPLIDTGRTLPSPASGEPMPIVISPIVDGRFGATAVLGIPSHDRTDALIAERLGLQADDAGEGGDAPAQDGAQPGTDGRAGDRNSDTSPPIEGLRPTVRYRANDFSISRQRSWGTPIPIVYCDQCGAVPVPEEQLPVLLPLDLKPTGLGNPLAEREDFVQTTCPGCGGAARRETDTLDCHFDALWLWVPACVPSSERERPLQEIFALDDLRQWLPSERLIAGSDSGNFVFDQRIVTKALRDIGPLAFLAGGEPFAGCLFHEMVIRDGRKMSKHLGNVVDPDELLAKYGADTVRLATLYAARPQRSLNWSDSAVLRCHRFLAQVWEFSLRHPANPAPAGDSGDLRDTTEHLRLKLSTWCAAAIEKTTEEMESLEMHSAVRDIMRLFDRIKDFEKRVLARQPELGRADSDALIEALTVLVQLLGPFAPHLSEELWIAFGNDGDTQTPWPGVSSLTPT